MLSAERANPRHGHTGYSPLVECSGLELALCDDYVLWIVCEQKATIHLYRYLWQSELVRAEQGNLIVDVEVGDNDTIIKNLVAWQHSGCALGPVVEACLEHRLVAELCSERLENRLDILPAGHEAENVDGLVCEASFAFELLPVR